MRNAEAIAGELISRANAGEPGPEPLKGSVLSRELGRGGMGVVYLVEHPSTGLKQALKLMLPRAAVSASSRDLFIREMHNAEALSHPNVVLQRAAGAHEDVLFIVLEFCEGGSIADLIEKQGRPLDARPAVELIVQALEGLAYLHQARVSAVMADGTKTDSVGLVHRDLKPHNILLARDGTALVAKVSDYGLAKAFSLAGLSRLTRTGDVGGTLAFMPRQQVINFKYAGPEVDVWAAAASLYFMLTGGVPREFSRDRNGVDTILNTDAIPIRQRVAAIPTAVADVLDLALIDRPQILIKSAADLKSRLQAAL
jgi:serine/threonine protein kinase